MNRDTPTTSAYISNRKAIDRFPTDSSQLVVILQFN